MRVRQVKALAFWGLLFTLKKKNRPRRKRDLVMRVKRPINAGGKKMQVEAT